MRYLGIDFGTKRIGLALSDEAGKFAMPKGVLENNKETVQYISKICQKEGVECIVVGKSLNFDLKANPVQKDIEEFVAALTLETMLPIEYENEVMSSALAARTDTRRKDTFSLARGAKKANVPPKQKDLDASAAAVILQSFLDRQ